jgi:hypothetical protein
MRGIPSNAEIPPLGIDSDGFFDLEEQPKRVAIIGAGYIAVELAGEGGCTFACGGDGGALKGYYEFRTRTINELRTCCRIRTSKGVLSMCRISSSPWWQVDPHIPSLGSRSFRS